ncbi:MAG: hypothetical protein ISS01_03230 [Nanoarchaeota archaeon]|nr:hypothetical protein [Nanoarchaeota archaeon]
MKKVKIELTINDTSKISDDINLELDDAQIEFIRIILKALENLIKK